MFSEVLDPASVNATTVTLTSSGSPVTGTVGWNNATKSVTFTPSAALTAGGQYTLTLVGGAQGIKDPAGNAPATTTVTFTIAPPPPPVPPVQYVSDLTFVSSSNGWGPVERDQSNGEDGAGDGHTLNIAGTTYPKGLGVHAASQVVVNVPVGCTAFTAQVGVDAEVAGGSVVFQVFVDGVNRFDSGVRTGGQVAVPVNVPVSGATQLRLDVTDGGNGKSNDHADWADAKLTCGIDSSPPAVTSTVPVSGASGVATNATVSASFSEAVQAGSVSFVVRDPANNVVPASLAYDSVAKKSTLTPTTPLASSTLYTATISGVQDLAGNVLAAPVSWSFTTMAPAAQSISFGALANRNYGDAFAVSATGGGSGNPVTFTASPVGVCTSGGVNGSTITVVGVGTCTVQADQAGNVSYTAAAPVTQSFTAAPKLLTVTAGNQSKAYGSVNPAATATITGFVLGQTLATSG